ncbi:MAG: secondary thiamine-phosphate synthase enzyme YjbQ [Myxococcota bacterium]|nr:secondary thiamine-phosphate synthase enzyme YjbQ [Myxococcota bacterium]
MTAHPAPHAHPLLSQIEAPRLSAWSDTLHVRTRECLEFIDLTDAIAARLHGSGVDHGIVNVQSRHTTSAVLVNENEPLLLEDLKVRLESFAPRGNAYRHDDFSVRTVNMVPGERPNGHAHSKALLLPASVGLNLVAGRLQLGRWQRVFFVELDRARDREISLLVLGAGAAACA